MIGTCAPLPLARLALASATLSRKDKARGQAMAGLRLKLLQDAVHRGDADFGQMDDDFALDPIRDDPAFVELMEPGHPDRRYAAVWSTQAITESPRARRPESRPVLWCGPRPDKPGLSPGRVVIGAVRARW